MYKTIVLDANLRHVPTRIRLAGLIADQQQAPLQCCAMPGIARHAYQVHAAHGVASYEERLVNDVPHGGLELQSRYAELGIKVQADRRAPATGARRQGLPEMEVQLAGGPPLNAETTRDATAALALKLPRPADNSQVVVDCGRPRLDGHVERNYLRVIPEETVCHFLGVRGMANHLKIRPAVEIKAVHGIAALDGEQLQVEATGGTVELDGTVHSWEAERAAWLAPGEPHVSNRIIVDGASAA